MSPIPADLVECWVFRIPPETGNPEFLLVQRAADRIFPGLWQPVTGGLDGDEPVPRAALREVLEETGLGPDAIEVFYDLDQVGAFFSEEANAIAHSVIFAVRVRPDAEPKTSLEHVGFEWVGEDEAIRRSVWPPYRASLELIGRIAADPSLARWFQLDAEGRRLARTPG